MPLQKPTHKKPREVIEYYEECTWLGNDTPMFQNDKVSVFQDKYPVIKGHLFLSKGFKPRYRLDAPNFLVL